MVLVGDQRHREVVLVPAKPGIVEVDHRCLRPADQHVARMQVGMIAGSAMSWPANVWLVRRGIKVPM